MEGEEAMIVLSMEADVLRRLGGRFTPLLQSDCAWLA